MQLKEVSTQSDGLLNEELAQVFSSYSLLLRDKKFVPAVISIIENDKINAEWALIRVIAALEKQFSKIDNPYIKARIDDIRQLGEKLMNNLLKKPILEIAKSVLVFIGLMVVALLVITYIPDLSLWLVHILGTQ